MSGDVTWPPRCARALSVDRDEFAARTMAVGFADLVGFTSLTRELDDSRLGALVEGFESMASDVVASVGARLVKTIGDEVLFVADDAATAAEVALNCRAAARARGAPDLRVGLASGTVLSRLGDVYGEPVNIAARLTSIARPGSVLVDRELATLWRRRPLESGARVSPGRSRVHIAAPDRPRRATSSDPEAGDREDLPAAVSVREGWPA